PSRARAQKRHCAILRRCGRKAPTPSVQNAIDYAHGTTKMPLPRRFHFVIAFLTSIAVAPALAETNRLTYDTRFCPSWAEAHERTHASLNNGRPPYPVKWKGCIVLKRGARRHHRPWRPMDGNCRPRQALVR